MNYPKIAIHHYKDSFSEEWIKYFDDRDIPYKIVDCYNSNIIKELEDIDILFWSWNIDEIEATLFAKELTWILEKKGIVVVPSFNTSFIYDNKIAQKYLLESIKAPFVKSYIFYDKNKAIEWINQTNFPKVCKLSKGAGSNSVYLCKTKTEAVKWINRAFSKGFSRFDRIEWFKDNIKKFLKNKSLKQFELMSRSFVRLFIPTKYEKYGKEFGYVYFQDFIPNNSFDIRIITIGDKAIGIKRLCRDDDFRASGSGLIVYEHKEIDIRCIDIAFEISDKLDMQYMSYDFIFDMNSNPLIVEISHYFSYKAYSYCNGYWDRDLNWHDYQINIPKMIAESIIEKN